MPRHFLKLLICIVLLTNCSFAKDEEIGGNFILTSHLNESYSLADSKGKIVLIFFGFTHCPDICPNTLSTVQTVLSQLNKQADLVQPLLITVDPKRDTPDILKEYLKYFSNNFIGLTGTSEEIDKVVKQYHGFYSYEGDVTNNAYSVDHSSNLYIIDTQGKVVKIMPYGLPPQAITDVILNLLSDKKT